jgi:hypothetical protein
VVTPFGFWRWEHGAAGLSPRELLDDTHEAAEPTPGIRSRVEAGAPGVSRASDVGGNNSQNPKKGPRAGILRILRIDSEVPRPRAAVDRARGHGPLRVMRADDLPTENWTAGNGRIRPGKGADSMRRSLFSEPQIVHILRPAEVGERTIRQLDETKASP